MNQLATFRTVSLPGFDNEQIGYDRKSGRIFLLSDSQLLSVPSASILQLDDTPVSQGHFRHSLAVHVEECGQFALSATGQVFWLDFEDVLHTINPGTIEARALCHPPAGFSISEFAVDAEGRTALCLIERDERDEPLLQYQWRCLNLHDGTWSPVGVPQVETIAPARWLGWWNNSVACFFDTGGLSFWHPAESTIEQLRLPASEEIRSAAFFPERSYGLLNVDGDEGQLATDLLSRQEDRFTSKRLLDDQHVVAIFPDGLNALAVTEQDYLGWVNLGSRQTTELCTLPFDPVETITLPDGVMLMFADDSVFVLEPQQH